MTEMDYDPWDGEASWDIPAILCGITIIALVALVAYCTRSTVQRHTPSEAIRVEQVDE